LTREILCKLIEEFSDDSPLNFLGVKGALNFDVTENNYAKNNLDPQRITADMLGVEKDSGMAGMRFFRHPIFSVGRADDPGFTVIKRPAVVGEHHFLPEDWLPGARSVISVFLPYERATVEANKRDPIEPPLEWVCTRVDGQRFLLALGARIRDALIADGYRAVTPHVEDRFIINTGGDPAPGTEHVPRFSSNWSERHVAFVTGLGTFGLSTNFISKVGCAGRLVSVVTDWDVEPDIKDTDDWLGYCNRCGECIRNCQGQVYYSDKYGKDHKKCGEFARFAAKKHAPRYGCGKCQTAIPCEFQPMKAK